MSVHDPELAQVVALIKDSFRVHHNENPVYVDLDDRFDRVSSKQHQLLFGRRGSGKSCLLVHFHRNPDDHELYSVYVEADEVKTLAYPDLLIRLLLSIFESLPGSKPGWWKRRATTLRLRATKPIEKTLAELRALFDTAEEAKVQQTDGSGKESGVRGGVDRKPVTLEANISEKRSREITTEFQQRKLDTLERHFQDYKAAMTDALDRAGITAAAVIVDDFYLIPRHRQPDVIDYLHRLCRGTSAYLKVGTVRHRTSVLRQAEGETIGVVASEDVEAIDLDQTFEDFDRTRSLLAQMLDLMGDKVNVTGVSTKYLSPEALQALTLASGGVPRDYLTTFNHAVDFAKLAGAAQRWVTPTHVWKGASRVSYETKLVNLRSDTGHEATDIELLLQDLLKFCLVERRKTAFLVGEDDRQAYPEIHELIMQLMDFKLIHIIEPNTSAASGRAGRYEAYTLDFSFFMEPRRRNIEHVEFWKTDDQRRRVGVRESPVYPLERASQALATNIEASTEAVLAEIDEIEVAR